MAATWRLIFFWRIFFQNSLETWYHVGSASLLPLSFSRAIQTHDIAAIFILSSIFYYWHNILEAVVSILWAFRVTASAEGCLSACTVFFAA